MSKHEKTLRRERKKTDRARRLRDHFRNPGTSPTCGSAIRNGAAALAAAAVIAAGTQAYASPVRFDNPAGAGHFDWNASAGHEALNILDDAASQPSGVLFDVGTFVRYSYPGYGETVEAGGPNRILGITISYYTRLSGVDAGELIPPGAPGASFGGAGFIDVTYPGYEGSLLSEGQQTYLGVRFDQGGGNQYGWIGVVRTGLELDAFAWGYETEVGVPVPAGAPEPGTLALLALGAGAALRRRHA